MAQNTIDEEVCKACLYARWTASWSAYGLGYKSEIECDPPMGECRLESNLEELSGKRL